MYVVGPGRAITHGGSNGQADTSHKQTRIRFTANNHDITTLSMQGMEESQTRPTFQKLMDMHPNFNQAISRALSALEAPIIIFDLIRCTVHLWRSNKTHDWAFSSLTSLRVSQTRIHSLGSKSEEAEYEECVVTLTLTARLSEYSICQSMGAVSYLADYTVYSTREHVPQYSTVGAEIGIRGACDWSWSRDDGF
jgi:hypothetical protein